MGKTFKRRREVMHTTTHGANALTSAEFYPREVIPPLPEAFCAACGTKIDKLRWLRSTSPEVFCSKKCFNQETETP